MTGESLAKGMEYMEQKLEMNEMVQRTKLEGLFSTGVIVSGSAELGNACKRGSGRKNLHKEEIINYLIGYSCFYLVHYNLV